MAEGAFESDFFKEWETLLDDDQPAMSLRKTNKESLRTPQPSRLEGETEDQRERRLKLARECSSRRRSMETSEQREKRLEEQRNRMSLKRKMESDEEREHRYVCVCAYMCMCVCTRVLVGGGVCSGNLYLGHRALL